MVPKSPEILFDSSKCIHLTNALLQIYLNGILTELMDSIGVLNKTEI